MKNNILEYKGYHTRIEFDNETFSLRGKIEGIGDLVNFSSKDVTTIEKEFHDAVDDYLEFCAEVGKEPDKEYKGTFNIRIEPELHKKLAMKAFKENESLNATVEKAIKAYLNENSQSSIQEETILILTGALATQRINRQQNNLVFDKESTYVSTAPYGNLKMFYNEKGMTN